MRCHKKLHLRTRGHRNPSQSTLRACVWVGWVATQKIVIDKYRDDHDDDDGDDDDDNDFRFDVAIYFFRSKMERKKNGVVAVRSGTLY